jgi:hypothetical protein
MAKKRKGHGYYCWFCGRTRSNEKFSGSGHARHLCKDCSKLGAVELQYRQEKRNLENLVTWEGIIGRKQRKAFNRFLEHPDLRIRQYAEELAAKDVEARTLPGFFEEDSSCEPEDDCYEIEDAEAGESPENLCEQKEITGSGDYDILF